VAESNSVSLGPNDRLVGQLHIDGDLHVSGTVEGELDATGNVEVGEGGKVKASISGHGVTIGGEVEGPVTAGDKLVLGRSGSLTGDIRVARLEIRDGARFSGNVSMGKPAVKSAAAAPPAGETVLAETAVVADATPDQAGDKTRAKKR
jgi:cytoskeletal protein CcmA (bactofilin family)